MEAILHKVKYIFWRARYYIFIAILIVIFFFIYQYTNVLTISQVIIDSSGSEKLSFVDQTKLESQLSWVIGKKYFTVNINEIKKIFDGNSFVKSVIITKIFPNIVSIYVQERKPFVSLEIDNNTCVLLDSDSFVLVKVDGDCKEINTQYMPIPLVISDPKMSFVENTQSTYYQVLDIVKVTKKFNEYSLGINGISIKDNVMKVRALAKKYFVFSLNQDINVQLIRMAAVMPEIEKSRIKYTTLDLRFVRPVLSK